MYLMTLYHCTFTVVYHLITTLKRPARDQAGEICLYICLCSFVFIVF